MYTHQPAISLLQIRINYYVWFNILIPIHAVQKKGVVAVFYDVMKPGDEHINRGMTFLMHVINFMSCLPIRYSGLHFCLKMREGRNLAWNKVFLDCAVKAAPKSARERARVHHGSDVELQYKLTNYGIPPNTFPVDLDGNLRESILNVWFHNHLAKEGYLKKSHHHHRVPSNEEESLSSTSSGDDEDEDGGNQANVDPNSARDGIRETDVLFGRGRLVQYHPGNIRFREFLGEHRDEYESLSRNERRQACVDLTKALVAKGTRFLKQGVVEEWTVCDFEGAVDKVSQFYRTRRRRMREQGKL
mmetsp:Transcript_11636/g.27993  ORF Transcript_11636/g.27993 Transcript_11636/m.27993 type:complete len:302 (+) Transcript_11636:769-1674(+)